MSNRLWVLLAAVSLLGGGVSAEKPGAAFLKLDVGAQSQALGGASLARVQDASAVATNPSALARVRNKELFFYHGQLASDYKYSVAAYNHPYKKDSIGVAVGYLDKGTFDGRDDNRNATGSFDASDAVLSIAYAKPLTQRGSVGAAVKYVRSEIKSYSASGMALDLSASYAMNSQTRLAAGVFHLGPSMKFVSEAFPLPATAAVGMSRKLYIPLVLIADVRYGLKDQKWSASLGGELNTGRLLTLRMGYLSQLAQGRGKIGSGTGVEAFSGMGVGLGLKMFSRTTLDYAFVPMGELGGTHHMNLAVKLP